MTASLQVQLGVGLTVSLVVLFGLQWLVVSAAIRSFTADYVASRLRHDTRSLLTMLTFTSDGQPVLDMEHYDPLYRRPFSGYYFEIQTEHGHTVRSRSLWDEDLAAPLVPPGTTLRLHDTGPKGQRLLVLVSGFEKQERALTIALAEDLAPLARELGQLQRRYVIASLVILIVLIAVQQLIVRLGFWPLRRVQQDMTRLERGEIGQLRETVPLEVRPLVREMNRLLAALEQRLVRSRHALGNLAHALKTPLTLVMQLADHEELRPAPAVRQQLIEHTTTVHQRLERELRRARLSGGATPGRRLVLADELPPLVGALQSVYRDKNLEVTWSIPPEAVFAGDREDVLELLGTLLDNACKWARQRVRVTVQEYEGLAVSIEDDGPGCPPGVLQQLAERGVRIDESTVGHGLGLAIARDIVEQYGGDLQFGSSKALGGLQVWVQLPARRTQTDV